MKRHRSSWMELGFYILSQLTLILFGVCHGRRYGGQKSGAVIDPLIVPSPVRVGDEVQLECHWEVGRRGFNAARWYRDGKEIYLYNFGEKTGVDHKVNGTNIVLSKSDDRILTLANITSEAQGNYTCEVMTEGPPFGFGMASKTLTVVDLPETPQFFGLERSYKDGDTLKAKCLAANGLPAPNITIKINGEEMVSGRIRELPPTRGSKPGYWSSETEFERTLDQRFVPTLILECSASVHGMHVENVVHVIVNERSSFYGLWGSSDSPSYDGNVFLLVMLIWIHHIC